MVLIDHLKFRSEISMICNVAMTHKSKEGRDGCARYIFQIIRVWSSPYIDSEADTLQVRPLLRLGHPRYSTVLETRRQI